MPLSYHPMQPALFERLLESQYWPREKLGAYQRQKLEPLLRHAREYVPFYKHRLDCLFSASGEINWSRWNDIPVLTRREVSEHQAELLTTALPPAHGHVAESRTSGSTDVYITVHQSEYSSAANQVAGYRGHTWHNVDWSANVLILVGQDPEKGTLTSPQPLLPWGPGWLSTSTGRQFILNRFIAPSDIFEFIARNSIGYLITRPIEAHVLALEALEKGLSLPLRAIVGVGTGFRPKERADCERAFGCKTINPYGAKEGGQIAFPCPHSGMYHLNEETVLAEIVDENNKACSVGEAGRVLVTPITNYAQPFIRYEQNDIAVPGPLCSCGRGLATLQEIVGRKEQLFQFQGGKKLAMTIKWDLLEELGVRYWQIAQVGPLEVEVRYVSDGRPIGPTTKVVDALRAKARRQDLIVSFRAVTELKRQPGGKLLLYINEVERAGHPGGAVQVIVSGSHQ